VKRIGWDRGLDVAADGRGLVGHAGAVLLRRLADRVALTGELARALPVSAAQAGVESHRGCARRGRRLRVISRERLRCRLR
jgi:hypothetical protein